MENDLEWFSQGMFFPFPSQGHEGTLLGSLPCMRTWWGSWRKRLWKWEGSLIFVSPRNFPFLCQFPLSLQEFVRITLQVKDPTTVASRSFCSRGASLRCYISLVITISPGFGVAVYPVIPVLWWVQEEMSIFSMSTCPLKILCNFKVQCVDLIYVHISEWLYPLH